MNDGVDGVELSDEQQAMVDLVMDGHNVMVDSVVGSGKTTAIQALCAKWSAGPVLYLTYSNLLKRDAQARIRRPDVKVTNYHGFVYPALVHLGLGGCGKGRSIALYNERFGEVSAWETRYTLLVVDEYQDIDEDRARLLLNIRSLNPDMRIVAVGDMEQRISEATRMDIPAFYRSLLGPGAEQLAFTRTFRMGEDMGRRLSAAWGKPVRGVNADQKVSFMTVDEAVDHAAEVGPGRFMVVGANKGDRTEMQNRLEGLFPAEYNKTNLYSAIREVDTTGGAREGDVTVFTTYDACKGMEREVCFVCDFVPSYWRSRSRFPDADLEILRNKFLVAASRGKREVVFVRRPCRPGARNPYGDEPVGYRERLDHLGWMPLSTLESARSDNGIHIYRDALSPEDCFGFRFAEDVEDAYRLLDVADVPSTGDEIGIDPMDGLMDLTPVIEIWQRAMYFDSFDVHREIGQWACTGGHDRHRADLADARLDGDPWHDSLVLISLFTGQGRYETQGDLKRVGADAAGAVTGRLARHLSRGDPTQVYCALTGRAVDSATGRGTSISFSGLGDVLHGGVLYRLRFVHEITHEMVLHLALCMVMSGVGHGVVWNTRDNRMRLVSVPDRKAFMDAVVTVATRRSYDTFEGEVPAVR